MLVYVTCLDLLNINNKVHFRLLWTIFKSGSGLRFHQKLTNRTRKQTTTHLWIDKGLAIS